MSNTVTRAADELTNVRTRIVGRRDGAMADGVVAAVRAARALRASAARAIGWTTRIVTGFGAGAIVLVVVAFVAGYAFGWLEAVVVAWTLSFVMAIAVCYVVGKSAYAINVTMPNTRVVVGESAAGELAVTSTAHRWLAPGRIELQVGQAVTEFEVPAIARDRAYSDVFVVPTARRGVIVVGPSRIVRSDPIGLLRRAVVRGGSFELVVHPRTIAIPSMSTGFVRDLEGNPTRDLTASDVSFHALREYAPGDEPRTIHWKSTAKTGSFMVRQYEETRRSHLMVALSLADSDYASDDEFELAVSVAGSLGVRAIRDGRTVSVVSSERTPDFAKHIVAALVRLTTVTPGRLLDDLSRLERASAQLRIVELARVASGAAAGVSVAFLVCGSRVGVAALRRAASQYPVGVEVVAVVCDPGAVPGLSRVGELSVLTIGYLEDLQHSLARSRAA